MPARTNRFGVIRPGARSESGIIMGSAWQDLPKRKIGIHTLNRGEAIISTIGILVPAGSRILRYECSAMPLSTELKEEIQAKEPQPVSDGLKSSLKKAA